MNRDPARPGIDCADVDDPPEAPDSARGGSGASAPADKANPDNDLQDVLTDCSPDQPEADEPSGTDGPDTGENGPVCETCGSGPSFITPGRCEQGHVLCRCGAGAHPTDEERCSRGHVTHANQKATVSGSRSKRFWNEAQAALDETVTALLRGRGYTRENAPPALHMAAETAAETILVRRGTFERLAEAGGTVTDAGRARRIAAAWADAADKTLRALKACGLDADLVAARPEAIHGLSHLTAYALAVRACELAGCEPPVLRTAPVSDVRLLDAPRRRPVRLALPAIPPAEADAPEPDDSTPSEPQGPPARDPEPVDDGDDDLDGLLW